jgi:hypothetical protein
MGADFKVLNEPATFLAKNYCVMCFSHTCNLKACVRNCMGADLKVLNEAAEFLTHVT